MNGFLCVILAAVFWAGSGVAAQVLTQRCGWDVLALTIYRLFGSGWILLVIAVIQQRRNPGEHKVTAIWKNKIDVLKLLFFAVCGLGIMQFAYFMAIAESNAATATFLQYISPALVVICMAVNNKKFPDKVEIVSVLLAIAGVFLIATHGNVTSLALSSSAVIWSLLSAVAYTVYTIFPAGLFQKYGKINILAWAMLSIGTAGIVKAVQLSDGFIWNAEAVLCFVYIVIFGTAAAFLLYSSGVERIGAAKSNTLATLEPLVSAVMTFFIMDASFTLYDYLGAACILLVTFLLQIK